jgi:dihydrofolate synthase/folylpolyglutamate synthase
MQTIQELALFFRKRESLGIKPGLERTQFLLKRMHHPEVGQKLVHVAGTNGKGSTIHFIEAGLRANDYRVGVFTSPSFSGICGHFLIDGEQVQPDQLIEQFNDLLPAIRELDDQQNGPTNFEIITVLAFLLFQKNVDVALIETGMGGRFDTTNCFIPTVSVITNVSIDHTDFLGNTIAEIAYHKAGIIKRKRPVVLGDLREEASEVILKEAANLEADVFQFGKDFTYEPKEESAWIFQFQGKRTTPITLHMLGEHQKQNAAVAMMACEILAKRGIPQEMKRTLMGISRSGLPGRFEVIHHRPDIILDSAHNVAGVKALINAMETHYPYQKKHLLFAGFKDKQLHAMLELLESHITTLYLTSFDHKRAASLSDLAAMSLHTPTILVKDWQKAVAEFSHACDPNQVYFITGSFHFITLVRQVFHDELG